VGGGFATDILGGLELRADLRAMTKEDDNNGDFGIQLSLNHRFQSSMNDSVYVTKPAEIRKKTAGSKPVAISLNVQFGFNSSEVLALYSDQLEVIAKGMRQQDDIQLGSKRLFRQYWNRLAIIMRFQRQELKRLGLCWLMITELH
jgi:hypothetical protein